MQISTGAIVEENCKLNDGKEDGPSCIGRTKPRRFPALPCTVDVLPFFAAC